MTSTSIKNLPHRWSLESEFQIFFVWHSYVLYPAEEPMRNLIRFTYDPILPSVTYKEQARRNALVSELITGANSV